MSETTQCLVCRTAASARRSPANDRGDLAIRERNIRRQGKPISGRSPQLVLSGSATRVFSAGHSRTRRVASIPTLVTARRTIKIESILVMVRPVVFNTKRALM